MVLVGVPVPAVRGPLDHPKKLGLGVAEVWQGPRVVSGVALGDGALATTPQPGEVADGCHQGDEE